MDLAPTNGARRQTGGKNDQQDRRRSHGRQRKICRELRRQGQTPTPARPTLCDPDLHGCRLDPAKYAGLAEGDAHVIRNAGGRASDDAIRSLVIRTSCSAPANGSSSTTPIAAWSYSPTTSWRDLLDTALRPPASTARAGTMQARPGSVGGHFINWHTIKIRTERLDDVQRIRTHPLVPR